MKPEQIRNKLYAAKDLAAKRVKELLPEGTIVLVKLGRAHVRLRITDHAWNDPLRVRGVNVITGKTREMVVGYDDFEITRVAPSKGGAR